MKKIDFKLITIIALIAALSYLILNPKEIITKVPVEVIKIEKITDTIIVDRLVEKEVIKKIVEYKTKIIKDTVVKEIEVPVEIVKTVYKRKLVDNYIEVPREKTNKWFIGFGYQFDKDNYFSGSNIKIVHKFKSDKMFSLDLGYRNNLIDIETGVSKLKPYIGASIYFRLDKDRD